ATARRGPPRGRMGRRAARGPGALLPGRGDRTDHPLAERGPHGPRGADPDLPAGRGRRARPRPGGGAGGDRHRSGPSGRRAPGPLRDHPPAARPGPASATPGRPPPDGGVRWPSTSDASPSPPTRASPLGGRGVPAPARAAALPVIGPAPARRAAVHRARFEITRLLPGPDLPQRHLAALPRTGV